MKKFKGDILFYSFLILGYIAFSVFLGTSYLKSEKEISLGASGNAQNSNFNIVLDAGHGGEDGGASSKDGILEKDINLSIALKLNEMFKSAGFNVVMTRDEDKSIYDDNAKTTRQKKVSDIKNRVNIINSDPTNILISIHQNKFPESKYHGSQIFFSSNLPESQKLAESIKKSITDSLQPENKRECKPAQKEIYILNKAKVPAVIVECGFLSNEEEAKKLTDDSYQQQIAKCVYDGFINYIG